ncbi:MAG: hypothetical protein HFJ54_00240 [Clostridia bacterium]|nr:hypothetical protein [Clostridia bacterium]
MMENYYNHFYPYRFYPRPNFRMPPYGKSPYTNSFKQNNDSNSKTQKVESENLLDRGNDKKSNDTSNPIFEIFGIKLFFDDILLIALIFFLYTEGVKDQNLFISLVLLLLS